jgi:hypothetical protein
MRPDWITVFAVAALAYALGADEHLYSAWQPYAVALAITLGWRLGDLAWEYVKLGARRAGT